MIHSIIVGGDKMKKYLDNLANAVKADKFVNVGFLEGSTYPDALHTSVPMVAAVQEYGAPRVGIPPRPYFRTMVVKNKGHWGDDVGRLLIAHDYNSTKVLTLMGNMMKGELQESIFELLDPPLSPVTLMLRKMKKQNPNLVVTGTVVGEAAARVAAGESVAGVSTKPLIESGHLSNSVGFEVK